MESAHPERDILRLRRIQAASGLLFAIFLTLHLATTASASAGPGQFDRTLAVLRNVYRPLLLVEIALIAVPGLVHIYCALRILLHRRKQGRRAPGALHTRLHRWSGYVLLAAIGGHVLATRIAPEFATGATATGRADLAFLAFSLLHWPGFFIPYYLAFGVAAAIHLSLGVALAVKMLWPQRVKTARALRVGGMLALVGAVVVALGVVSIVRQSRGTDRSRFAEYRALYHRFVPFLKTDAEVSSPSETGPAGGGAR